MKWNRRKVLVTGGASFIGSHLVDALIKKGADVIVADDFSSGKLSNLEYPLKKLHRTFSIIMAYLSFRVT